jgi:hypothetical protein
MTDNGNGTRGQSKSSTLRKVSVSEDWFEVYEIADNLFVFCETRHYENTTVSLIIGPEKAILIDTGCGIGNLRKAVDEVTDKPVIVINTHTHLDHLGSNRQFDEIAMFDHRLSRRVAVEGAPPQTMQREILAENLVTKPWPQDFDSSGFALPWFAILGSCGGGAKQSDQSFDLDSELDAWVWDAPGQRYRNFYHFICEFDTVLK